MLKLNLLRGRLHCSAENVQFAQNFTVKSSSFLDSVVFGGLHGSLSAPVTRSSVNADSHYANVNDLLNAAFRWRKPFSNR